MATYTEHYNLKKPQPSEYYAIADFNGNADVIDDELFKKVDKVSGKGLSTNDYTNADKSIVDGVTSALADKVDKVTGKGLSTNDYDNTAKGIVDGVTSALAGKVDTSLVGSANGVAELDANGKVPSAQLPSYVDDVLEYADLAHFPATGESGKIYIAEDTNKTYRWSGSNYAEISESLALGETSSTAYAGNKGKANADAIAGIKNGTSINSFGAVETALAGKANASSLADYATLDNSGIFPDANVVTKELVYINGYQSDLRNYPSEVSNTVGILLTRWFCYSGDLTVARMQLVFTLMGLSFCRFFDGTSWTPWQSTGVGNLNALTTTDKSSVVGSINEVNGKTSATHEAVAPSSDFYVEDWYIDRIGDLRLLTITSIKNLASGYNTPAQLSSSDKPYRTFLVRLGDVTIRVRDDRYIDIITNTAISGTTYLNVVIPFTV